MTLPSNACLDVFPGNTLSSYKINLPKTLYLKQDYEVALAEIHYPVSWRTFADINSYSFSIHDIPTNTFQPVYVPIAFYEDVPEFVKAINNTLKTFFEIEGVKNDSIVIDCNKLEQKVRVRTSPNYNIQFSPEACQVLGLEYTWYSNVSDWGRYIYNISRGFHALYVYCSVVEPQIVGDVYAPLLRTVAAEQKRGQYIIKAYGKPHYVRVNAKEINTIEINIKDDTGANVSFTFGKVICKLHFQQRSL